MTCSKPSCTTCSKPSCTCSPSSSSSGCSPGTTDAEAGNFRARLDEFDDNAAIAVRFLVDWLRNEGDLLTAMARGRLAAGHYRYSDKLLYRMSEGELEVNAAEELADAIVYVARLFALRTP